MGTVSLLCLSTLLEHLFIGAHLFVDRLELIFMRVEDCHVVGALGEEAKHGR